MQSLKNNLKSKLQGGKRIAVLGIGSELICDDACGMLVARRLQDSTVLKKNKNFRVFLGSTSPENLTGEIKKFKPSHLIIIDAADFKEKPGSVHFIESKDIDGVSFSTHRLPTSILSDYLIKSINCKICVIGIQPKSLDFCAPVSAKIKETAKELFLAIKDTIINSVESQ